MKNSWLAYVIVALLAIGAGVVIAGLPDDSPAADTLAITATSGPSSSVPASTDGSTTTTEASTTPSTEPDPTTTSAAPSPSTTEASAPTTVAPTTEPPASIPDRAEIIVVTANGSGLSGSAALNAERLREAGYDDVRLRNGTQVFEFTTIFHADGFEEAALRMADDLELLPDFVAPLADAPVVIELPEDVQLLAYIGIDRSA